jgi:hypothetical protein
MTGRCTRRRAADLALLAVALPGCVMGHLVDAGRRRDTPIAVTAAGLDGDRLLVRYVAEVSDDGGTRLGTTEGAAAIPVARLRVVESPAADTLAPDWVAPDRVARARPVPVARGVPFGGDTCAGPVLEVVQVDGRDSALVWRDSASVPPWAPVPTAALTRLRIEPWVWPLVPAAFVVDAVLGPILLFSAPAMVLVGE